LAIFDGEPLISGSLGATSFEIIVKIGSWLQAAKKNNDTIDINENVLVIFMPSL
jgi:hypothetical protein